MQARSVFFNAFGRFAQNLPMPWLLKRSHRRLIAPFYHLVSDALVPHVEPLYPVKTRRQFVEDLDFLLAHFRAVDFFEFRKLASGEIENSGKPAFLLSFDDGLREFHDVAAPILLEKGVPAICFLNSEFIDNQSLFYRYKAALLVDFWAKKSPGVFSGPNFQNLGPAKPPGDFKAKILAVNYQNRHLLDDLAATAGLDFDQFLQEQKPYLTTSQIENLLQKGFHFGAHSLDHPEYRFLDLEEQIRQTTQSVEAVCHRFSLDYRAFSFPFTDFQVGRAFFERTLGAGLVDFSFGGAGIKNETQPGHFQRLALENGRASARETLHAELLYFLCKTPLGKNTLRRA